MSTLFDKTFTGDGTRKVTAAIGGQTYALDLHHPYRPFLPEHTDGSLEADQALALLAEALGETPGLNPYSGVFYPDVQMYCLRRGYDLWGKSLPSHQLYAEFRRDCIPAGGVFTLTAGEIERWLAKKNLGLFPHGLKLARRVRAESEALRA